jgi:hypothetical protein
MRSSIPAVTAAPTSCGSPRTRRSSFRPSSAVAGSLPEFPSFTSFSVEASCLPEAEAEAEAALDRALKIRTAASTVSNKACPLTSPRNISINTIESLWCCRILRLGPSLCGAARSGDESL